MPASPTVLSLTILQSLITDRMQLERTTRSAWVESLALLTSLTCDSTQADRVVRPIRIRCKL